MREMFVCMILMVCSSGCGGSGSGSHCGDGVCSSDESAATCCDDCGCADSSLQCQAGQCVSSTPAATCGDGTCETGETSANCCTDCGCQSGSSCQSGQCVAAPTCGNGKCEAGETVQNCCSDCGCPSGQSCSDGQCQATSQCGDGICGSGETAGNCCIDCGCSDGYSCKSNSCLYEGESLMTWSITNDCVDKLPILLRFFDANDLLYWTATSAVAYENTQTFSIECTTGNSICYGGEQPSEGYEWGAGYDGSMATTCSDCCAPCSTATYGHTLVCN